MGERTRTFLERIGTYHKNIKCAQSHVRTYRNCSGTYQNAITKCNTNARMNQNISERNQMFTIVVSHKSKGGFGDTAI